MTNIFEFSYLADKHCINYDNWEEYSLLVLSKNGIVKFNQTDEGLNDDHPSDAYVIRVSAENSMQPHPITEMNNMVTNLN